MSVITHNNVARAVPFLVTISSFVQRSYSAFGREVRRGLQNALQGDFFWSDPLEGGTRKVEVQAEADQKTKVKTEVTNVRSSLSLDLDLSLLDILRTAFANEDAGGLFPGSLGEADTRAFHQHGPSHGLVPSG